MPSIIPSATAKAITAKIHFSAQRRPLEEWLVSLDISTALYLPETHLTSPDLILTGNDWAVNAFWACMVLQSDVLVISLIFPYKSNGITDEEPVAKVRLA